MKEILMLGLMGFIIGLLLTVIRKIRVWEQPKIRYLTNKLPGLNCGVCGFTCRGYARAIKEGEDFIYCKPGGNETYLEVGNHLGILKPPEPEKKVVKKKEKKEEKEE